MHPHNHLNFFFFLNQTFDVLGEGGSGEIVLSIHPSIYLSDPLSATLYMLIHEAREGFRTTTLPSCLPDGQLPVQESVRDTCLCQGMQR